MKFIPINKIVPYLAVSLFAMVGVLNMPTAYAVENPQNGATGLQGKISSPPPTTPARISTPGNGQSFNNLPVTVAGICSGDLLVKLFKNNVFAGSVQCKNGSFSMQIDLFNGQNDLIARVYDALDQAGPDSNTVTVTYNSPNGSQASRIGLTSNFAKRGANPGQALTWPIILSGGTGPYAFSIDWGDGKAAELKSVAFPGTVNLQHTYDNPGVYNIIVKATDANGSVAFLQLVGVGNGPLSQNSGTAADDKDKKSGETKTVILWQPAAALVPLILLTFWLGKKHELKVIKQKIERGERPF
jgi:hypothetical protein